MTSFEESFEPCPHAGYCPHLGASVKEARALIADWHSQSFRTTTQLFAAEDEIDALRKENRALNQRITELEAKLKQTHRLRFKKNRIDYFITENISTKRGAPKGHKPWSRRKPKQIDETVQVDAPKECPHCSCQNLQPVDALHTQIQEDIVLQPSTKATEFVHAQAYCPRCRRNVFDTAPNELRNCQIGPVTQAVAVYLRHCVKLSYRDIEKVFKGLFGMPFVPASAMAFSARTARQGESLYEDLRNKIQHAHLIHADETHWRIDGKSAFLWYAGNTQLGFFHADHSRSSEVAVSILGKKFEGSLVADSYAAYNATNPKRRQACLAHIIGKAKEIEQRLELIDVNKRDEPSRIFCNKLAEFFSKCCRLAKQRSKGELSFKAARSKRPGLEQELQRLCKSGLKDKEAENLRLRVSDPARDWPRLFTFLEVNHMSPTNNLAEQALRLPVILRKITFGSRSLFGAQNMAINLSLLDTARRQERCPINLLKSVLLNGSKTSIDELFSPGSVEPIDSS